MQVLFCSGDIGGARAIIPIMGKCLEEGICTAFVDNGHISKKLLVTGIEFPLIKSVQKNFLKIS
jgi:hypothetical protein